MILEAVDKKISIFDISHLLLKNWIKIVVGILVGMVAGYIWWSFGTAYGIQITLVRTNIGETQTIRYIPVQQLKTLLPEIAAKELSEKELSEKHNSKYIKNLYKILSNELWWDKNLQELDKDNIFSKSKEKEDIQKKTSSNAWRIRFYDKSFKELNGTINFIDEFFLSRSAYIELSNLIENLKRKSSDVYAESATLYLDEIDKNIADLRTDII
jgi:hypothetical protein